MENASVLITCKSCSVAGTGIYCSNCGQAFSVKRITLMGLVHDVFHFFTHLERGFGYTIKRLVVAPGVMQREYVDGVRGRYQKPFSMFFVCASVSALVRYWISQAILHYHHLGNASEIGFYHHYMVLSYTILIPFMALLTWSFFFKERYNFAETGVMLLYNFSFIFLAVTVVAALKLIWPLMDTAYVELPILLVYNVVTFVNFYRTSRLWVAVRSLIIMVAIFWIAQMVEDAVMPMVH